MDVPHHHFSWQPDILCAAFLFRCKSNHRRVQTAARLIIWIKTNQVEWKACVLQLPFHCHQSSSGEGKISCLQEDIFYKNHCCLMANILSFLKTSSSFFLFHTLCCKVIENSSLSLGMRAANRKKKEEFEPINYTHFFCQFINGMYINAKASLNSFWRKCNLLTKDEQVFARKGRAFFFYAFSIPQGHQK